MTPRLPALVALVAVWLLTLASVSAADAAIGAGLAVVVALGLRPPRDGAVDDRQGPAPLARLVAAPALVAAVLADVAQGSWDVTLRVLGLRPLDRPGVVVIPIGDRTERGVAATGLLTALSPGSLLLEVDHDRHAMLFHIIDARDPDAVRARFERFYQRYQRRVIP